MSYLAVFSVPRRPNNSEKSKEMSIPAIRVAASPCSPLRASGIFEVCRSERCAAVGGHQISEVSSAILVDSVCSRWQLVFVRSRSFFAEKSCPVRRRGFRGSVFARLAVRRTAENLRSSLFRPASCSAPLCAGQNKNYGDGFSYTDTFL